MNAVVTGAGGFIGSHLCRRLCKEGVKVRGLFLPGEDARELEAAGVEVFRGDLLKPESLAGLLDGQPGTVFHLAARVLDWGSRDAFYRIIVKGTENLLDLNGPVARFVFLSSIGAYGVGRNMEGFTEETPCKRTGVPYGDCKMEAEALVRTRIVGKDRGYTIIRPANVIGPGSVWVREALNTFFRGPVPLINGGDFSASLVDVENLVEGIWLAASLDEGTNECFNLRDHWNVTWKQYLSDLGELVGMKPRGNLPSAAAWPLARVLEAVCSPLGLRPPLTRMMTGITGVNNDVSTSKAKRLLGWETRITYEESLEKIKSWVKRCFSPPTKKPTPFHKA